MKNCCGSGRSRPSARRVSCITSGGASAGTSSATGSPERWSRTKMTAATPTATVKVLHSRRRTWTSMARSALLEQEAVQLLGAAVGDRVRDVVGQAVVDDELDLRHPIADHLVLRHGADRVVVRHDGQHGA